MSLLSTLLSLLSLLIFLLPCTVLYSTVLLYCTVQQSAAQHGTAQHSTAQHSAAQHSTVLYCTVLYCTVLHCTLLYSNLFVHFPFCVCSPLSLRNPTVQYSTVLYSTVLYNARQYSTVLYCAILFSGIARTVLGFAENVRRQKLEAEAAYMLRAEALAVEPSSPFLQKLANTAAAKMSLDVEELHWLADVLNISIRCTLSDEVFKQFQNSGSRLLQDAVYGPPCSTTDVHIYLMWLVNPESREKCGHYCLMRPCEDGEEGAVWLPADATPAPVQRPYQDILAR